MFNNQWRKYVVKALNFVVKVTPLSLNIISNKVQFTWFLKYARFGGKLTQASNVFLASVLL